MYGPAPFLRPNYGSPGRSTREPRADTCRRRGPVHHPFGSWPARKRGAAPLTAGPANSYFFLDGVDDGRAHPKRPDHGSPRWSITFTCMIHIFPVFVMHTWVTYSASDRKQKIQRVADQAGIDRWPAISHLFRPVPVRRDRHIYHLLCFKALDKKPIYLCLCVHVWMIGGSMCCSLDRSRCLFLYVHLDDSRRPRDNLELRVRHRAGN